MTHSVTDNMDLRDAPLGVRQRPGDVFSFMFVLLMYLLPRELCTAWDQAGDVL